MLGALAGSSVIVEVTGAIKLRAQASSELSGENADPRETWVDGDILLISPRRKEPMAAQASNLYSLIELLAAGRMKVSISMEIAIVALWDLALF